jgi:hypothetical protein
MDHSPREEVEVEAYGKRVVVEVEVEAGEMY